MDGTHIIIDGSDPNWMAKTQAIFDKMPRIVRIPICDPHDIDDITNRDYDVMIGGEVLFEGFCDKCKINVHKWLVTDELKDQYKCPRYINGYDIYPESLYE